MSYLSSTLRYAEKDRSASSQVGLLLAPELRHPPTIPFAYKRRMFRVSIILYAFVVWALTSTIPEAANPDQVLATYECWMLETFMCLGFLHLLTLGCLYDLYNSLPQKR